MIEQILEWMVDYKVEKREDMVKLIMQMMEWIVQQMVENLVEQIRRDGEVDYVDGGMDG